MLLGSAYGKVEIDASGVQRGVTNATRSLKTLEDKAVQMGRKMQDVGKRMTVALTLPLAAVGGAAIKAASDLEEATNKANVVFEDFFEGVQENARSASTTLGISKRAYLDYASSIGAALKAGGMGLKETTQLSEQAVKHFVDLASFHNGQVEDMARAWESAIRGQYEPIQRVLPFITNEYIKTYGIANGLLDANVDKLTTNQRAIVLNAIALNEQLNPALNDFAETSEGFANTARQTQALLEDISAELGEHLLPMALETLKGLNQLLDNFKQMPDGAQKAVVGLGAFLAALGPIIWILGTFISLTSSLIGTLNGLGVALPTVSAGASGLSGIMSGSLVPAAGALVAALSSILLVLLAIGAQFAILAVAWEYDLLGMQSNLRASLSFWKSMWAAFTAWWRGDNDAALAHLQEGWATLTGRLQENFGGFIEWMKNAWGKLLEFFANMRNRMVDVFKIDWSQIGRMIVHGILSGLLGGNSALASVVQRMAQNILNTFKNTLGIGSPSRKAMYFGRMTSEGYLQGMAAHLNAKRIADMLARPTQQVAGASSFIMNNTFEGGLTVRESSRIVDERLDQMARRLTGGL